MSAERAQEMLAVIREHKEHLWNEHQERDMPISITMQFDKGVWDPDFSDFMRMFQTMMERAVDRGIVRKSDGGQVTLQDVENNLVPMALDFMFYYLKRGHPGVPHLHGEDRLVDMAICSDGYGITADKDYEPERGDLRDDFLLNPDSKVIEMITAAIYCDDMVGGVDSFVATQDYTIGDGGVLVWSEPHDVIVTNSRDGSDVGAISGVVYDHFHPKATP